MEPDILAPESSPPRPRPPPLSPSGFTVPATPPHGNYMMDVEKVAHGPPQGAGAAPIPGPTSSALLPLPEGGYLQHEEGGWAMWSEMVEAPQSPPRYRMTSSSNLGSPMRGVEPTTAPQPGLSTFRRLFVGGDEDVPMAEAGGAVSAHSEASSAGPNPQEGEMDAAGAVARLQRTHALDDALAGADAVSAGPGQRRRGPRGSRSPQNAPLPEAERDAFLASLDKDRDDYLEPTMLGDVDYEEEEADDDVQDREDVDSETPEQAREALRAIGIMREKPSTLDKIIREHCNPDEAPKERLPTKARERELAAMIAEHNLDSRFPETIDLLETMAKERKQVVPPGGKEKAGSPYLAIGAIVSQTTGILEFTIFVPGCDYSANYKVVKKSILFLTTETMRTMALKLFTPGDGGLYKNASFQLLDTHLTFFVRLLKYRGMDRCKVTLADESDLFWVPGWFASRNHRGLGRVSNICICALLKYSLNLIADDVREHTMQGWPQEEIHEHPEGFLSVPSVPIQKKDRPIIVSYGGSDSKLNGRVRTKGIVSNEEIKLQLGRALAAGHSLMRVQPRPVGPLHEKLEKFRNLMQKYLNVASEFKSFSQLPTEAEWRPFFEADFKAKGDTMLDLILTDPISAKHVRDEGQVIVTDEYKPLIGPIRKGALSLSGPTASPHFRVRGHPGQAAIANRAFEGKSVIMTMDVVAQLDAACNGAINDAFFMPMMDELGKVRRDAEGKIIYASFLTKYVTFRQGSAEPEWSVLGLDGAPKEFLEAWRSPHPLGSRMRKSDRIIPKICSSTAKSS
ncbi:hypothetical protein DFJ74DRAFT_191567 [Hyaloraphidium curvatum]|nr:hypothetical protein DFJ74DRAFT_191567 [Hyaloraphidium curvatum]